MSRQASGGLPFRGWPLKPRQKVKGDGRHLKPKEKVTGDERTPSIRFRELAYMAHLTLEWLYFISKVSKQLENVIDD